MPRLVVLSALASTVILPLAFSLEGTGEEELCEGATCAEPHLQQATRAFLQTQAKQWSEMEGETRADTGVEAKVEKEEAARVETDAESNRTAGACQSWCKADIGTNGKERHCKGNMIHLCGDCDYCQESSGGPAAGCQEWCESDISTNGKTRHCITDMKHLCGKCSYCTAAPTPKLEGVGRDRDITIKGRQVLVNGVPIHLKGVCWGPVPKGKDNQPDFKGYVQQDVKMMKEAGINAVRTYVPITDKSVLDVFWENKIWVIMVAHTEGSAHTYASDIANVVNSLKDHPAILMWSIGNEWNYNGMYDDMAFNDAVETVAHAAKIIKENDKTRPVSSIYGEVPDKWLIDKLWQVDAWGINVYRGIGFDDTFQKWAGRSGKPLYFGEYGADAWNAYQKRVDEHAQAKATRVLTEDIWKHSSVNLGGVTFGGFIFEWNDEWWKDGKGSVSNHDVGGIAPGGGPYPDKTFNEEYWGIVTIDRKKRKAFDALAEVQTPKDFAR